MPEPIDEFFLDRVSRMGRSDSDEATSPTAAMVLDLFDAQLQSRHLDFAARWLQAQGEGFYTIGSAGHEANAAVGLLSRVRDPALLHYRSGGFYAARARVLASERGPSAHDPIRAVLLSLTSAAADPMSGGRHKVFGHPDLGIIPQTSTIGSHLPRAVGLALALGSLRPALSDPAWPADALVVCSFGDASANHSTAQGALNAAAYLAHRQLNAPVLFVCEDNGIGISTRTPAGWTERMLQAVPGLPYLSASDAQPDLLLGSVQRALDLVRSSRRPAVLHLRTVRFMGHAGSDAELAYRSQSEIAADYERDPLVATAAFLVCRNILTPRQVIDRYEDMRTRVMTQARDVRGERRLNDRREILGALTAAPAVPSSLGGAKDAGARSAAWGSKLPESRGRFTLGQAINAALTDVMVEQPHAILFGEDVSTKGGVYGITRGLRKRFGGRRVFDTLLDEQTILGTALGTSLAGFLPIPEIQYLAYLHNAEDQLRGEAASLQFFSAGQYRNPMVVRIAGLAYQKGFGGHFHNDNSVAVLRDIPGLVLCVPSHARDAPGLLRECVRLAEQEGRVCVFLEPIALYHTRDLHEAGDGGWTADYETSGACVESREGPTGLGTVRTYGAGRDLLMVTFGNGVPMSLRAAHTLERDGVRCTVLDLRWLSPLPQEAMLARANQFGRVLIVDETRASGGVSEGVLAALIDGGYTGRIGRVASADTFIPLGPAADHVLLSEREIVARARGMVDRD